MVRLFIDIETYSPGQRPTYDDKKLRNEARELTSQAKKKIDEFLRNAS
jgi:hypothetical protein